MKKIKEEEGLTDQEYEKLKNWLGWIQARIPEAKKGHNAFWLRQALRGYADEFHKDRTGKL